jgi:hypothetical protein
MDRIAVLRHTPPFGSHDDLLDVFRASDSSADDYSQVNA